MDSMGTPGVAELGVIAVILLLSALSALLTVIPFWKICSKSNKNRSDQYQWNI